MFFLYNFPPFIFLTPSLSLHLFPGVSLSNEVYQSPSKILVKPDGFSTLNCSHKISNYDTILWYHRSVGDTALKLIGYSFYKDPKVEPSYQIYFNMSGDGRSEAFLHLFNLRLTEDSGEYFCAIETKRGCAECTCLVNQSHCDDVISSVYIYTCLLSVSVHTVSLAIVSNLGT
uniref:Ig-like domain-containing protein n=1 Tax=Esox lucius TaxID=8010 RepID=A0AAY5KLL2_ESOLU